MRVRVRKYWRPASSDRTRSSTASASKLKFQYSQILDRLHSLSPKEIEDWRTSRFYKINSQTCKSQQHATGTRQRRLNQDRKLLQWLQSACRKSPQKCSRLRSPSLSKQFEVIMKCERDCNLKHADPSIRLESWKRAFELVGGWVPSVRWWRLQLGDWKRGDPRR